MSTIGHFERLRALCGNARLLVTGGVRAAAKSQVVIFDHAASKVRHTLELPAHVLGMALAGERLLCACADGALRIFRDAYRADPSPRVLYHLGAVAAARGQSVEARDLLRRFLADPNVEPTDPLRAEAQKLLDGLTVQPAGEVMVNAPRGAFIEADGRLLGTSPLALPLLLPAGAHQIAVQQGKWRGTSDAKVPTGRQLEVRFKSGADVAVVTLPPGVLLLDEAPDAASAVPLNQAVEAALKRENYATVPRATALKRSIPKR